ncbi:hypothetical protein MMC22_001760 [Lobaria immixta]|nr:hypothetical protein [Lobaria immixta]
MASTESSLHPQEQGCSNDRSSRSRSPTREGSSTTSRTRATKAKITVQTDLILPVREPYMQQIVTGQKTYIFRKNPLKPCVQRIWLYRTVPHCSLDYVCEILPPRTRTHTRSHPNTKNITADNLLPDDPPLEEDGSLGNSEFNNHHSQWEGYDYAYKIASVYKLDEPIPLQELKNRYGVKGTPRGMAYAPLSLTETVELRRQSKLR